MSTPIPAIFRLRRDIRANWENSNPVLKLGEVGIETNSRKLKFGNGVSAWNDLPYGTVPWSAILDAQAELNPVGGEFAIYFVGDGGEVSAGTYPITMWARGFMNAEDTPTALITLGLENVLTTLTDQASAISGLDARVTALEGD